MEQNKSDNQQQSNVGHERRNGESIGNQQGTAQTGAQNAGGENIDQEEDQYTEDLRRSGNRKSRDESNEG